MYFRPASSAQFTASASGCFERTLASFTSIGRFTPAITSTPLPLHHRDREVGRRAAEHVGQQHHAVAGVAPADTGLDLGAAVLDVVVGPDADRIDVPLRADHVLHGGSQFLGQAAVGHQDHADHWMVSRLPWRKSRCSVGHDRRLRPPVPEPARLSQPRREMSEALPVRGTGRSVR